MMIKKLKSILSAAVISLVAIPMQGQDLLARQAPIDRKMKTVDSIMLRNLIIEEMADNNPSAELYTEWSNRYAHLATTLPDSLRIDLRDFCMPTPSRVITSNFGARWGRQHKGLDIKVYTGDTIKAAFSGKIRIVRYEPGGYGNYVVIRHHNGLETIYGHMSKNLVKENQDVKAGEPIGLGGSTGRSTGSHLHFETRLCGIALNPALMFDFRNQDVVGDFYLFRKSSYNRESAQATRMRGVSGSSSDMASASSSSRKATNTQSRLHKVKKGETLYAIARKRGTTVDALCKLNRIGKNVRLLPGQILKYN